MKIPFEFTIIFVNYKDAAISVEPKVPVVIKEIQYDDIRLVIPKIRSMNETKFLQFEDRMKTKGDRCFVAWIQDTPVHFSWVRTKGIMGISSAKKSFAIPKEGAWIFDCRTHENFRGLRIYPHAISYIGKAVIEEGKAFVMIDTTNDNKASIKGIERAGFTPFKKIYRLGKITWIKSL